MHYPIDSTTLFLYMLATHNDYFMSVWRNSSFLTAEFMGNDKLRMFLCYLHSALCYIGSWQTVQYVLHPVDTSYLNIYPGACYAMLSNQTQDYPRPSKKWYIVIFLEIWLLVRVLNFEFVFFIEQDLDKHFLASPYKHLKRIKVHGSCSNITSKCCFLI